MDYSAPSPYTKEQGQFYQCLKIVAREGGRSEMVGATPFSRAHLRLNNDDPYPPFENAKFNEGSIIDRLRKTYPTGIRLAICITMYNEDWKEFDDTMTGILINVQEMV
jgi:hypothetical protein